MRVAAVVLAAGEASRFGSPKQRLLLPRVLERLAMAPIDEIVVVQGAHALDLPSDTVSQGVSVRLVACPDWNLGPGASLRCGLEALPDDVAAAVIVLADGPRLSPTAVERVVGAWRKSGGIVAASYEGNRGHPVVLGRADWGAIPDEGLRAFPSGSSRATTSGSPGDVDTRGSPLL